MDIVSAGNARRRKKRGFELKREAKDAEALERQKLKADPPSLMTFRQLYLLYVEAKSPEWLNNTKRKFMTGVEHHILPFFGEMKLENISTKDVEDWKTFMYNKRTPKGNKYEIESLRCIRGYLNALFNYAANHRYINFNPARTVSAFKDPNIVKKAEKIVWTKEEFSRFIECVDDEDWRVFFMFLWCTGVRIGEAQGVMFKDIDFENRTVFICKSVDTKQKGVKYAINPTKNKETRKIELPVDFIKILKIYTNKKEKQDKCEPEDFLFGIKKPLPNTTVDKARREYINKSGVKYISSHCFRHSHATYLLSNGIDIKSVSERLGHKDVEETLNTYAHVLPNNRDRIIALLNKSLRI